MATSTGLGSSLPVMQAAIGRVADARLVQSVAAAGGLATLGASYLSLDALEEQLDVITSDAREPFVVNLILAFDQRARLRVALDHRAPWISFSWGLDDDLVREAHASGSSVLVQVADETQALAALAAGADGLIVQGVEAGGHVQGTAPLVDLLPAVRDLTERPLVAAGGISSTGAARRAVDLGADVVSLGTRFAACAESLAHPRYRAALISASSDDTVLTDLFDIGWAAPHRVLRTPTVRRWQEAGEPTSGHRPAEGSSRVSGSRGALPLYSMHPAVEGLAGEVETLPFYAGMDVGSITSVETAAEVVHDIRSVFDHSAPRTPDR
jgi:NAD(P)H-dependent flavin oxidoreductase YrpB (nitropropane dioxygenase family)